MRMLIEGGSGPYRAANFCNRLFALQSISRHNANKTGWRRFIGESWVKCDSTEIATMLDATSR